jgi:hypothetical protein
MPATTMKIIAIAVGALIAFAGVVAAGGGGAALAGFGSDGKVSSGSQSFSTSASSTALVTSAADINEIGKGADVIGAPRVRLSVRPAAPGPGVFVGVAPAADVERYLASASVDEVTDFDVHPFRIKRAAQVGYARPGRPGKQSFWTAQSSGRHGATLDWKIRSGAYRVVVMNADASPGVHTRGDVSLTVPHVAAIAWSLIGGGIALLLAGIATIVVSARASAPSARRSPAYSGAR